MGQIDIKRVENSQSPYYHGFIELPFSVYRDNKNWIPFQETTAKMLSIKKAGPL